METIQAIRFDLNDEDDVERMLVHLEDYGYAVVADVAGEEAIASLTALFWDYLEGLGRGISRDDPSTWGDSQWVGDFSSGIIRSPAFCHSPFMWQARLLPRVRRAFAAVWGTDELLVSFDGGNAFRPPRLNRQWLTRGGGWWHVDQNHRKGRARQGRVCVQGLLALTDANDESGGLCVVPASHRHHQAICERSPSAALKSDFVLLTPDDPILSLNPPVLVGCQAGDLVLWDSRLVHCNCPSPLLAREEREREEAREREGEKEREAQGEGWVSVKVPSSDDFEMVDKKAGEEEKQQEKEREEEMKEGKREGEGKGEGVVGLLSPSGQQSWRLVRLVAYVCMLPRKFATSAAIRSRKRGFLYKAPTSHWPTEEIVLLTSERLEDEPSAWSDCPVEQLKLIGFTSLEIQWLRFRMANLCRDLFRVVA